VLVWFFRDTWRQLDRESTDYRIAHADQTDYRPAAAW
jgi:hypothetical protein